MGNYKFEQQAEHLYFSPPKRQQGTANESHTDELCVCVSRGRAGSSERGASVWTLRLKSRRQLRAPALGYLAAHPLHPPHTATSSPLLPYSEAHCQQPHTDQGTAVAAAAKAPLSSSQRRCVPNAPSPLQDGLVSSSSPFPLTDRGTGSSLVGVPWKSAGVYLLFPCFCLIFFLNTHIY